MKHRLELFVFGLAGADDEWRVLQEFAAAGSLPGVES